MQIRSLRIKSYRSWRVNDSATPQTIERLKQLEQYDELCAYDVPQSVALRNIGWSRATYYRWRKRYAEHGLNGLAARSRRPRRVRRPQWDRATEWQVLALRRRHPCWGKLRIRHVLCRDEGCTLSVSTVGRILIKAMRRGSIRPCAFYEGRTRTRRPRRFTRHARRWTYQKADQPGELVQFDHATRHPAPGVMVKVFQAVCPVTRQLVVRAYATATARNARTFLRAVLDDLPFPLQSIQVDGGSEFMAEFEEACRQLDIPLHVLPPKRPQCNGCVERANRTVRCEFFPFYDDELTIAALNRALVQFQEHYNDYRPHQSPAMMTPNEYAQALNAT